MVTPANRRDPPGRSVHLASRLNRFYCVAAIEIRLIYVQIFCVL